MGYFSNGSEGMDYEARWCDRCVHQKGPDGKSACAVWMAHYLRNYKEANNEESILHMLIPRSKNGLDNERCKMFLEQLGSTQPVAATDAKGDGGAPVEGAPSPGGTSPLPPQISPLTSSENKL